MCSQLIRVSNTYYP